MQGRQLLISRLFHSAASHVSGQSPLLGCTSVAPVGHQTRKEQTIMGQKVAAWVLRLQAATAGSTKMDRPSCSTPKLCFHSLASRSRTTPFGNNDISGNAQACRGGPLARRGSDRHCQGFKIPTKQAPTLSLIACRLLPPSPTASRRS